MKSFLSLIMVVILSLSVVSSPVSASTEEIFSFHTEKDQVTSGGTVRVVLSAKENVSPQTIAGFRVALEYSSDFLIFNRVETTSQIKSGTFRYTDWGNELAGTYVCDGKSSTKLSGECISFLFSVRENVSGTTQISASLYDVVDWEGNPLADNNDYLLSVKISPPASSSSSRADDEEEDAFLMQIEPSAGTLSPDFSPDIHRYNLEVDASVSSVDFYLPVENGSAKASRKTLLSPGLDTWITITVKNSSGKSQEDYLIVVHRKVALESSSVSSDGDEMSPSESSILESSVSIASAGETSSRRPSSQQSSSRISSSQRSSTSDSDSASASRIPTAGFTENPPPADAVYRPSREDITVYGDRSLYLEESQFSPFLLGICTALACMGVGAIVFPFFKKN